MRRSVWKAIDRAARNGSGITLTPDELSQLMQHGSIYDEVEFQVRLEEEQRERQEVS